MDIKKIIREEIDSDWDFVNEIDPFDGIKEYYTDMSDNENDKMRIIYDDYRYLFVWGNSEDQKGLMDDLVKYGYMDDDVDFNTFKKMLSIFYKENTNKIKRWLKVIEPTGRLATTIQSDVKKAIKQDEMLKKKIRKDNLKRIRTEPPRGTTDAGPM
jgi:hypothetical protein